MKRLVRLGVTAVLGLAVVTNAALLAGIVLTREPAPRPLTSQRIATASRPAIALIQSNYEVTTSQPQPTITQTSWDQLDKMNLAKIYSGQITTNAQLNQADIDIVLADPDRWFSAGNTVTDTWPMVATGSGFFVTEDGYLVTAAHVVSASKTDVHDELISEIQTPDFVATDRNDIKKGWSDYSLTAAQIDTLVGFDQRWLKRYLTVDKIDAKYYLGSGSSVKAGDSLVSTGARATVVSVDPTIGGHDIAILKADVSGVPTLPIASGPPRVGDATIKVAYPRVPYLQESVPLNQSVPTVAAVGHVERQNPQQNGSWSAWGTDAEFTHGDSGGPVLDASGNVMGIVSFSEVDSNGNQLPGQGYFVPSQYIREDLAKANIAVGNDAKNLTNTYYRALVEGDNQRYKSQLTLLEDIQARSSWDAYIKDDILQAQSAVLSGIDRTPPDLTVYVLPVVSSAGAVILLVMLSWVGLAIAGGRRIAPRAPADSTPIAQTQPADN